MAVLAILGGIYAASAANKYRVTILVQVTYVYYENSNYTNEVDRSTLPGTAQAITVYAETPYEAEQQALNECSTMCQSSSVRMKKEGPMVYKGKQCYVMSYKEPYDAKAELVN